MDKRYTFSAGPSMIPEDVLKKASEGLINYNNSGFSVMELSHRSSEFEAILSDAENDLRKLLNIPDNYKVLFLQGGASTQFSAVPLNLLYKNGKADYVVTGLFSKKAYVEAQKYGDIRLVASSADKTFSYIPKLTKDDFRVDADYVHICFNNTIYGTKWNYIPDTGDIPLVADMSSCILSEPVDVSKFGLIYAGAQKNMGPSGVTVVIVRDDLIGHMKPNAPVMFDYKLMADNNSMYNTPPCWSIYMAGLVYKWVTSMGGVEKLSEINHKKAKFMYDYLDSQNYYVNNIRSDSRSIMNVTFVTGDAELDKLFVKEAGEAGFMSLKGHRSVGGMRASIYNAMPIEAVEGLVNFMNSFAKAHPKKEGN